MISRHLTYCLEKKFEENETLRQPDKKKLKVCIDWVLSKSPKDIQELIIALQKEKIQTVLRQNKEQTIYGITFIDYRTKSVFKGSDIGKQYSIGGLESILKSNGDKLANQEKPREPKQMFQRANPVERQGERTGQQIQDGKGDLLKELVDHEKNLNKLPYELLKKKKKKRHKNL